jgi:hypothetical protein
MALTSYEILVAPSPGELNTLIAAAIAAGKQPHGSPFEDRSAGNVCQAVAEGLPDTVELTPGTPNGVTVTAVEQGAGPVHQTVLTLSATPVTVGNTTGASFGGVKLYDFPAGRIAVLGVVADLDFDWDGTSIAADGSGDVSMGTTITSDATLDGTDVNLLPSTGLTDPFVAGQGSAAAALAAAAQFDGTSTPIDANLNLIIDNADVEDGASDVVRVTGTVTMTWIVLGDY